MSSPATDAPTVPPDGTDPSLRLAAYMARTQGPLDLLALLTLWIVLVPPRDFGAGSTYAWIGRLSLSVIYAIDFGIRMSLAKHHWRYARQHPLSALVVVFPPIRVVFSVRLITSVFRRGNLVRFLLSAAVLVVNGAIVVYFFERNAAGSNIHTIGNSLWWSVTTVSTVGYGDYYPVTAAGQVAAVFIMAIGILTLAVVTAQVAAGFVDQASRARRGAAAPAPDEAMFTTAELHQRLARIEELLSHRLSTEGEPPN